MVSGPLGLRTAHGLRTTRSPDRSWSPDYMVSGSCRFGHSRCLPFPDHRPRSAGWAWARMPRHARTACVCKDTHCLALEFHGGSTHLLLQAHPCPGSSATFSNPGKKNCGRFGLALFFWVVLFGFKLGAVQHALTPAACCHRASTPSGPPKTPAGWATCPRVPSRQPEKRASQGHTPAAYPCRAAPAVGVADTAAVWRAPCQLPPSHLAPLPHPCLRRRARCGGAALPEAAPER